MAVSDQPIGRETLDELLRRLRPRLKQVLSRYRVPAHDAEDLIQEALISTIQKWDTIQDPEAWLLVTLRNRCVVYWRKRRSSLYNSVDTAILELLSEPVAAPQERQELLWDLNQLLDELPEREDLTLVLVVAELPPPPVARICRSGTPSSRMISKLSRSE